MTDREPDREGLADEDPAATAAGSRGRFSARRKQDAVLRLLHGESLELLSRELGVTAATLSGWRDWFLAGGRAALKSRRRTRRPERSRGCRLRSASVESH